MSEILEKSVVQYIVLTTDTKAVTIASENNTWNDKDNGAKID